MYFVFVSIVIETKGKLWSVIGTHCWGDVWNSWLILLQTLTKSHIS